jgi:hypothetical protein
MDTLTPTTLADILQETEKAFSVARAGLQIDLTSRVKSV